MAKNLHKLRFIGITPVIKDIASSKRDNHLTLKDKRELKKPVRFTPSKYTPEKPTSKDSDVNESVYVKEVGEFVTLNELFGGSVPQLAPCVYDAMMPALIQEAVQRYLSREHLHGILEQRQKKQKKEKPAEEKVPELGKGWKRQKNSISYSNFKPFKPEDLRKVKEVNIQIKFV